MTTTTDTRYYGPAEAVTYLTARGFVTTPGTLAVWRCHRTGPAYRKLRGRVLYSPHDLDAFLSGGVPVLTLDSGRARR